MQGKAWQKKAYSTQVKAEQSKASLVSLPSLPPLPSLVVGSLLIRILAVSWALVFWPPDEILDYSRTGLY
jgi:hypothetical protein